MSFKTPPFLAWAVLYLFAGSVIMSLLSVPPSALAMIGANSKMQQEKQSFKEADSGALNIIDATGRVLGKCPLKHTAVSADISGYVSRVKVEQTFSNPYDKTIEAIYTFPLSDTGAVNKMCMHIGSRTIRGVIKTREEALKTYEKAKSEGRTASLLDQERPNIFTQSVANIPPGGTVKIEINYVDYLSYEAGNYTFAFPMTVGPRYMPGSSTGTSTGTGWSQDTNRVPDASRISPPVVPENMRAGHDVSMVVNLNAGVPIQTINSKLHKVSIDKPSATSAKIQLSPSDSIPNKDFVLSWKVSTDIIRSGYLTHRTGQEGYFSMMLLPPATVAPSQICPRELNFIIDRSGSQNGLPLQKARETVLYILDRLNPNDTFQVLSFSSQTERLFPAPVTADSKNLAHAKKYVAALEANGGTEMRDAVEKATQAPAPENRLRIFILMTDGYIGNDKEVIGLVNKTRNLSRWFVFGTGNSVNRFLINGIAKAGGGEADFILLNSPGAEVAKKFSDKISSPVLTDIQLNFNGVSVADVQPRKFNDLWAQRPLYVTGKYLKPGSGSVTIKGLSGGKPYTSSMQIQFPEKEGRNSVLSSVWARAKVDDLMQTIYEESPYAHSWQPRARECKDLVTKLGLEYHLLTDYTSFVAVDESGKRYDPTDKTVTVGVEAPDGVSLGKIFGNTGRLAQLGSVDRYTYFPSSISAPIGRVEGPRDVHLFQVEPTLIDERPYTSGRVQRHQKTSPTLPPGAPIPDEEETEKVRARAAATPPHAQQNEKLSGELQTRLNALKPGESIRLKLKVKPTADIPTLIKQLKKLAGLRIIAVRNKENECIVRVTPTLVQKLAAMPEILEITSYTPKKR